MEKRWIRRSAFRNITLGLSLAVGVAVSPVLASADNSVPPIRIYMDEAEMSFGLDPVIVEGTTLVPFRALFEQMGLEVEWEGETRTVVGTKERFTLQLQIDQPTARVNGEAVALDVPPRIIDGSTYVPLRFIGEATGRDVVWDGPTRSVHIYSSFASDIISILYSSDLKYEGETIGGKPHGQGKYYYKGNLWYEGEFREGELSGTGTLYDKDNVHSYYSGEFRDNLMNGQGRTVYDDGSVHEGQYINGDREGPGKNYYPNGELRYEGSFHNNSRSGTGTYYFPDGSKYVGEFENGQLNGTAKYYNSQGELNSEGEYANSVRTGQGTDYSDGVVWFKGTYKDGKRSGTGQIFHEGKLWYEGEFAEDKPYGYGKYYDETGRLEYEGQVKGYARTGTGTLYYEDGTVYQGELYDGKPDGAGKLLDAQGNVLQEGIFIDGKLDPNPAATAQTNEFKIRTISKNLTHTVIDGINPNELGLSPNEALIKLNLSSEDDLHTFQALPEAEQKDFINTFVQSHWGDVLGVNDCYVQVVWQGKIYALATVQYNMESDQIQFQSIPEGTNE